MATSKFTINAHAIGTGPCYIIAEVGSNHDKVKQRAFEMIKGAAASGADAVKFQLFRADRIAAQIELPETKLNDQFAKFGKIVYDLYKNMELPLSWLRELKACCDEHKVDFLATPFDEEGADTLAEIGVPAIKVASFEITHIPFLKHLSKLGLPVLLSTGMANLDEISAAVNAIRDAGEDRIALFHCGIGYPMPLEKVNLACLDTLRTHFNCPVGYSDHTDGFVVPIAAVAKGAQLYEKHITLKDGKSPDHDFAITLEEFSSMVASMRQCEAALGSAVKDVQENEMVHLKRGRRSLFIIKSIAKGDIFTKDNIRVLRPGTGLPPVFYEEVLGKKSTKDIQAPAMLKVGDWC